MKHLRGKSLRQVILVEESSSKELPPSDWPVADVRGALSRLVIDVGGPGPHHSGAAPGQDEY